MEDWFLTDNRSCLSTPRELYNTCTFIDYSSDIVVNKGNSVEFCIELPIQKQLILLGSSFIFKGLRGNREDLLRTKERF